MSQRFKIEIFKKDDSSFFAVYDEKNGGVGYGTVVTTSDHRLAYSITAAMNHLSSETEQLRVLVQRIADSTGVKLQ